MATKCDNVCLRHGGRENSEKLNTMQRGAPQNWISRSPDCPFHDSITFDCVWTQPKAVVSSRSVSTYARLIVCSRDRVGPYFYPETRFPSTQIFFLVVPK